MPTNTIDQGLYGLHAGFLESAANFPERPALDVAGRVYTYQELREHSAAVAVGLSRHLPPAHTLVGVLANRSLMTYAGILATLMVGGAVVPLNPGFPPTRTLQMVVRAGLRTMVVDDAGLARLDELLGGVEVPMSIVCPQASPLAAMRARWPQHAFVAVDDAVPHDWMPISMQPDDLSYLFFTSGSTGTPKGVGMLHRNTLRFVAMSLHRYRQFGLDHTDRFSQFYDITFDSSLFDLFVCWALGACLCCPSPREWLNPNRYILDKSLTVIDIVPSAGHAMNRRNGWQPGRFPALRLGRFGGEALSAELAKALAGAAPNAIIDNAYGPTECTVDASHYRWQWDSSPGECQHGMVPIGYAGAEVKLLVVDDDLQEVTVGSEGELLIGGPQVTPGYWQDSKRTTQSFITMPGRNGRYYRTGDLVKQINPSGPIAFLGRRDHQIKIGGVRIELGEIEARLREAAGTERAVALGWPPTTSGARGIVAFVEAPCAASEKIRGLLKERLPNVMVPHEIRILDVMPVNSNGKLDRKALLELLEQEAIAR
jgi:amino acid adenylation domain-containing protein